MYLTKSLKSRLVGWGCLTLGGAGLAAACSVDDPNAIVEDAGGASGAGTAAGNAGGSDANDGGGKSVPKPPAGGAGGDPGLPGAGAAGNAGASPGQGGHPPIDGGEGGGGGVGGSHDPLEPEPSICDGSTRVLTLNDAYIDNFETDAHFVAWYAYSDTPVVNTPPPARAATGAVATDFRLNIATSNINSPDQGGFGAGIGYDMTYVASKKCLDLSAFDGISFWARGTSPSDKITFQLVVPASQPPLNNPPGDCMTNCFVHPQRVFTIGDAWQHFTIAFSELSKSPAPYQGRALTINFVTPDTSWDFSIDEVSFYHGTAPAGAVVP